MTNVKPVDDQLLQCSLPIIPPISIRSKSGPLFSAFSSPNLIPSLISSNTSATIIFGNEQYDVHNSYDNTTGIFTAPFTGAYHIDVNVGIINNITASGNISATLNINDDILPETPIVVEPINDTITFLTINFSLDIALNTNDIVSVSVFNDSNGNVEALGLRYNVHFLGKIPNNTLSMQNKTVNGWNKKLSS